ncbi:MAG: hypothetical protein LBR32_09345 [Propionibacteriaceae bacterium]|jgi:hypothetical protein|nr:hypothetical protein [Propionibacteriaceae bacterium]
MTDDHHEPTEITNTDPDGKGVFIKVTSRPRAYPEPTAAIESPSDGVARPNQMVGNRFELRVALSGDSPQTWMAFDETLDRYVLIRLFAPNDARVADTLAMARKAGQATDARVLRLLDVGLPTWTTPAYLVYEYCAGQTLASILAGGKLRESEAAWVVREVADALSVLQGQGLSHSQVNPETVVITTSGNVKLTGLLVDEVLSPETPGGYDEVGALGRLLYAARTAHCWDGDHYGLPGGGPQPLNLLGHSRVDDLTRRILGPNPGGLRSAADVTTALSIVLGPASAAQDLRARLDLPSGEVPISSVVPPVPVPAVPPLERGARSGVGGTIGGAGGDAGRDAAGGVGKDTAAAGGSVVGGGAAGLAAAGGGSAALAAVGGAGSAKSFSAGRVGGAQVAAGSAGQGSSRQGPTGQGSSGQGSSGGGSASGGPSGASTGRSTGRSAKKSENEDSLPFIDDAMAAAAISTPIPPPRPAAPAEGEIPWKKLGILWGAVVLAVVALVLLWPGVGLVPGPAQTAASTPTPTPTPTYTPLFIAAGQDFDPKADGGSGGEKPGDVDKAFDQKPKTAWRTERYKGKANYGGLKPGTGIILDLGDAKTVRRVEVKLVGEGTDLEIRVPKGKMSTKTQADWTAVAAAKDQSGTVTFDVDVKTEYVLVYLTKLPKDGTMYRGGIYEVSLLG